MGFLTVAVKSWDPCSDKDTADGSFSIFFEVGYSSILLIGLSSGVSCSFCRSIYEHIFFDRRAVLRVIRLTLSSLIVMGCWSFCGGSVLSFSFLGLIYSSLCSSIWLWCSLESQLLMDLSTCGGLSSFSSSGLPLCELLRVLISTRLQSLEVI